MGYKCAPQIKGLVRGEPKNPKHRADGGKICREQGKERISGSETLDRERSHLNRYGGEYGRGTGQDCWDQMVAEAEDYEIPVKLKNGGTTTRGLPKNAVIGYAMIFNPPEEMCAGWDRGTYQRFYKDSFKTMGEIEPRLFRTDTVCMYSIHRDEGKPPAIDDEHIHLMGIPKDEDDRYCGNLIDSNLCARISKEYPRLMREKGWDLDDLDTTDWERYKEDEAYRAERKAKWKKSGKPVNDYIADKKLEAAEAKKASLDAQEAQIGARDKKSAELMERAQNLLNDADIAYDIVKKRYSRAPKPDGALDKWLDTASIRRNGGVSTMRQLYEEWEQENQRSLQEEQAEVREKLSAWSQVERTERGLKKKGEDEREVSYC